MFEVNEDHYLQVGLSALKIIETAMLGLPAPQTILDLPCGFGRVTRTMRARYPDAAITVCDLDRAGVDFAAATFGARGVYSEPNFRDLELGGTFDLIWVGSLLTHLPEHQTRQFLDFAARHMGPDSRLVVTSHGEHVVNRMRSWSYGLSTPAARGLIAQYLSHGYAYRGYDGDPAYGISLTAKAWYETVLAGSPLRLQSYQERGWDGHQDAVVICREPARVSQTMGASFFERSGIPLPLPGAEQESLDKAYIPGFDEAWYCNTFTDVAAAVRDGTYSSGLAHYLIYGWKEGRPPFNPQQNYDQRSQRITAV